MDRWLSWELFQCRLKRHSEEPRDRVLADDELRALWAGLDARPGRASDVLKLRLLLGQRIEEELNLIERDNPHRSENKCA
jgi:hypothetical protein